VQYNCVLLIEGYSAK